MKEKNKEKYNTLVLIIEEEKNVMEQMMLIDLLKQ